MANAFELIGFCKDVRSEVLSAVTAALERPSQSADLCGAYAYDKKLIFLRAKEVDVDVLFIAISDIVATDVLRRVLLAVEQRTVFGDARLALLSCDARTGQHDVEMEGAWSEFMDTVTSRVVADADKSLILHNWKSANP